MRITILGPGRLGRTFALLLKGAGHDVELLGRGARAPASDVVLLTVPDAALTAAAAHVPPGPVLLHCSGASDHEVLRPRAPVGTLHPLMTFPGPERAVPTLAGVAAAISGDAEALDAARSLARDLGLVPVEISGDRRLYHAAAVMAGNFATVLLAEASAVLAHAGVPSSEAPRMLANLTLASIQNASRAPGAALTGPAARGDERTIDAHRDALTHHGLADALALYDLLTRRARALAAASRGSREGPTQNAR